MSRVFSFVVAGVATAAVLGAAPQTARPAAQTGTPRSSAATIGDKIYNLGKVHKIYLTLSAAEWSVLQTSSPRGGGAIGGSDYLSNGRMIHVGSGFGGYFPWTHVDVRVDDPDFKGEFKDAGIRYKGNLSFQSSSAAAPLFANFKLKFDQHGARASWDGERTFNLHAGVVDTSRMKETIAYTVFRGAGVPASRTAYAELFFTVPGVYQNTSAGIFTMIEDINKTFLERLMPPGTGLLMKPEGNRGGMHDLGDSWSPYTNTLRPARDATPREQQRVIEFAKLISQSDVNLFRTRIGSYLDIDEFLRFIAVNAIISNGDSYLSGGHNYYLYLNPVDDKFRFIPWDQDLSMGGRGFGAEPGVAFAFNEAALRVNAVRDVNGLVFLSRPVVNGAAEPPPPTPPPLPNAVPLNTSTQGQDILQPWRGDQPLIYWLMDDPANTARYRAILKEISQNVFTQADMKKLMDTIEPMAAGRGTPRPFVDNRTTYLAGIVSGWK